MSFNSLPLETASFPSSNHSLYTPSYSTEVLVPIRCEELDLEPSLPIAPKVLEKPAPKPASLKRSSPVTQDPIQYQKLKMNYLRRLNVVPIVSQKDVLAVLGQEHTPKPVSHSKKLLNQTSKVKASNERSKKHFVSSFLPSSGVSSKPIAIPPRSKKTQLPTLGELEKGDILSFTSDIRAASLIPDHFGVFFRDFEL